MTYSRYTLPSIHCTLYISVYYITVTSVFTTILQVHRLHRDDLLTIHSTLYTLYIINQACLTLLSNHFPTSITGTLTHLRYNLHCTPCALYIIHQASVTELSNQYAQQYYRYRTSILRTEITFSRYTLHYIYSLYLVH